MQSKRFKLAFTVAGTVIGAGFATGKELLLFFGNTPRSLWYLVLCVLLMSAVSILYFGQKSSPKQSAEDSSLVGLIFLLFSAVSYTVMLACGGEALRESTGLSRPVGTVLTCEVTLGIVFFGVSNVYRFNLIATPVLLICMAGISLAGLITPAGLLGVSQSPSINLLIYSGYNLLSVLPVLSALSDTVSRRDAYFGIAGGFLCILAVGISVKLLLIRFQTLSDRSAIPILSIISNLNGSFTLPYTVMLYLSILTTAVNSLFAVVKNKNPIPVSLLLCGCSFLGFTPLIETLYPLFGYIGIGVTAMLVFQSFYQPAKKGRI